MSNLINEAVIDRMTKMNGKDFLSTVNFSSKSKKNELIKDYGMSSVLYLVMYCGKEYLEHGSQAFLSTKEYYPKWKHELRKAIYITFELDEVSLIVLWESIDPDTYELKGAKNSYRSYKKRKQQAPHDQDGTSVIKVVLGYLLFFILYVFIAYGKQKKGNIT